MNRQEKEQLVKVLKDDFLRNSFFFAVGYRGLSVADFYNLRKAVRAKGGQVKAAKLRLIKRAMDGVAGADQFVPLLNDQVALIFSEQESPEMAKVIFEYAKNNDKLSILAGLSASEVFSADAVKRIAQLPAREVLLAQVCGTLKAPMQQCVGVLNALLLRMVLVLKSIEEKKKNE